MSNLKQEIFEPAAADLHDLVTVMAEQLRLMNSECNKFCTLAYAHGVRSTPEDIAQGQVNRDKIKELWLRIYGEPTDCVQ